MNCEKHDYYDDECKAVTCDQCLQAEIDCLAAENIHLELILRKIHSLPINRDTDSVEGFSGAVRAICWEVLKRDSGSPALKVCEWFEDDDGRHSGCGKDWEFIYDGPTENGMKFCFRCGDTVFIDGLAAVDSSPNRCNKLTDDRSYREHWMDCEICQKYDPMAPADNWPESVDSRPTEDADV